MKQFSSFRTCQYPEHENLGKKTAFANTEMLLSKGKVTVWCAVAHNRIIGPYCYENKWHGIDHKLRKISGHAEVLLHPSFKKTLQSC